MSPSYGYTYLTSYGWTGTGTGLRKGAIAKPLAIPPKKNLSGLGKDRDEAFPFWDHLFTSASKAIKIKVSSDDEDADEPEDPSPHSDPGLVPLRRTTTGIISNRRPINGTPASTSGTTTPSVNADADAPSAGAARGLSLIATAKREAAKLGLYSRFFRGPVLGPDNDPRAGTTSYSALPSSESSSISTPVPEHVGVREDVVVVVVETRKKRKTEDKVEERRERKRLKKERDTAKAARNAEKALAAELAREKKDRHDRRSRKHRDEETQAEENQTLKKARKEARESLAGSAGDDLEPEKCTRKGLEEELTSTNDGQQGTSSHRLGLPSNTDATDTCNTLLTTKKKKGKRKVTPS